MNESEKARKKAYYLANKGQLKKYREGVYHPRVVSKFQSAGYKFTTISEIQYAYSQWSTAVKKRDKWTCVKCGSKESLVAHHIIPKYTVITKALDINNGITLCVFCHDRGNDGSIHNLGGNHYTPKQFYEWLNSEKKDFSEIKK